MVYRGTNRSYLPHKCTRIESLKEPDTYDMDLSKWVYKRDKISLNVFTTRRGKVGKP